MKFLALALSTLAFGCIDSSDTGSTESDDTGITEQGRIATNGLLATNALAILQSPGVSSNAAIGTAGTAIAGTSDGNNVLGYLVSCALDTTQSVTFGTSTYTGSLGIATNWKTGALTLAQANAVSGCVLARLNKTGMSVSFSLRGALSPIVGTEGTTYGYQEGAFWGNVLKNASPWTASACVGTDQATNPSGVADMVKRRCAVPTASGATECGLAAEGLCSTICTTTNAAGGWDGCDGASNVMTSYLNGHL